MREPSVTPAAPDIPRRVPYLSISFLDRSACEVNCDLGCVLQCLDRAACREVMWWESAAFDLSRERCGEHCGVSEVVARARPDPRVLLLISNEPPESRLIAGLASRTGWRTIVLQDAKAALRALIGSKGAGVSAIVIDQASIGEAACNLISELKFRHPEKKIVFLAADSSAALAVEAMRAGASDYLIKPFSSHRLMQALRLATDLGETPTELQPLSEKLDISLDFESMVGAEPVFRAALAQAARSARGNGNVLIQGERGTGKDMLLRAMHAASRRASMPLQWIRVRQITDSALESVLFGHEQGAFPGAFQSQVGALQDCDGGTLVVDEIDRLPQHVQARLAEAVTEGRVRPIGANHSFRVNVRVFATSNQSLAKCAVSDALDPGLAQAFAKSIIELPPLRTRTGDIAAFTRYFLGQFHVRSGLPELSVTEEALGLLASFRWPGNVRQLQAVLFRAAVSSRGAALTAADFPHLIGLRREDASGQLQCRPREHLGLVLYTEDGHLRPLREIEADIIRLAIGHYNGRMTQVARKLGLGRSTLYRKLAELGIESPSGYQNGVSTVHPMSGLTSLESGSQNVTE